MQIDRILYNGRLPGGMTALAISNGRILDVGTDDAIRRLAGPGTVSENLDEKYVLPGLIDAHIHWQWTASQLQSVDVFEVPSKQAALDAVAARVRTTAPGEWITGHGWAQDLWPGRAFPTAADLDAVAPENPVYLTGKSVHVAWVNTLAMREAGLSASTIAPEGGGLLRDDDGEPLGILLEWPAMRLVMNRIPPITAEQLADQMRFAQEKALACGLTAIHDFDDPDALAALQLLRERGELSLRVHKNINKDYFDAVLESGLRSGFGDDWIRLGALKLFADGALGPRTAHMLAPYDGEPENCGLVVTGKAEMMALVRKASAAGFPTTIHAIGDRAVRDVLDIFEAVREQEAKAGIPRDARRHRIEHVQVIHPDDVGRLAVLDIIASMQPIHATSDYQTADRYWGDRAALSYNARVQIDQGTRVAFGSDSPIEPFDPLKGIHAAVTRRRPDGAPSKAGWYPEAKLTVDEALDGYTIGAAYAAGLENRQGQLRPGYFADLIVIDRDLYAPDPDEILETDVVATMVAGEWKFGGV